MLVGVRAKTSGAELPRDAVLSKNTPSTSWNPNVSVGSAKLSLDKRYLASLFIACFDCPSLTISAMTSWMTAAEFSDQEELTVLGKKFGEREVLSTT